ncbi:MAG: hypothetical protein FWE88_09440 [Phycisphaerae bacterium]|nr:hypothetical protein [Phycisphaerae bacterium]
MRRFDDLKPFLNADIESDVTAANADFVFSRNLFAAGASNGISPARFSLVADNYAYWFLNGTRPGGGVRYRHKDRANALMLDGSARAVWEISAYGWHVLKE